MAVRKFLLMKTNKDKGYPEFYFSTPISVQVAKTTRRHVLASTEELAIQKLDELIAENIKKGWEEVLNIHTRKVNTIKWQHIYLAPTSWTGFSKTSCASFGGDEA